ncbi:MAG TPA: BF3164 family lipoprotein [Longimicrobium sp.]
MEHRNDAAVPLVGETVAQGEYLDSPRQMAVVGDRLVLLDRSAPMIHVFRLPGGERVGSLGREGEGPGEFRSTGAVQADPARPETFWVFDGSLDRMTRLRFSHHDSLPGVDEVVNLQGGSGMHFQPVWIDDGTLAATGIYLRHPGVRLLVTDRGGRPVRTIGTLPEHPGGSAMPTSVLQHAYEARLAVHPDRALIAVATRHADRLEIYRTDGTLVRQVTGGDGFIPAFEVNQRAEGASMATGDDLRVGYLDLASTRTHVYALFSGRTRAQARGRTYFGKEVHVFDWTGERAGTLALDERAFAIAIDTSGTGYLYAVRHDPEPNVARYPLPGWLRARERSGRDAGARAVPDPGKRRIQG